MMAIGIVEGRSMSLNRNLIGKQYLPQDYGVTAEATMKYARAYNEDNPWFLETTRPGGIIAPPMFGVVMSWLPILMIMSDSDLGADLLRLLHSEQDIYFSRTVAPGDIVTSTAKILAIEERATGESLVMEVRCTDQRGEPVQQQRFTGFFRGKGKRDKRGDESSEKPPSGEPLLRVSQAIDVDQTYRYAQASGDHNPIHVDENVAKMAGLPGIIVHGLCTMAFTSKVMIDYLCDHDPRRLKRLRVRFSRPVFPGQTITTAVWPRPDRDDLKVYAYKTDNPYGKAVIKDGIVEVATR
jgi:acyl dehydratase